MAERVCAVPAEPDDIESLGLTFTAGLPGIGEPVSMALCEDGDDVAVTANNLREYVQAYADCILRTSVEKQVGLCEVHFRAGPAVGLENPHGSLTCSMHGIFRDLHRHLITYALRGQVAWKGGTKSKSKQEADVSVDAQ